MAVTGSRQMQRMHLASRVAWIGLLVSSVAITALAVWSTVDTLRLTVEVQRNVTLSDGWKQIRFWIAEEETLERKYRIERVRHVKAYHDEAVRIVHSTAERLRAGSTDDDNRQITKLLTLNARYAAAMAQMFSAVDARDERRVDAIHGAIDPVYDGVEHTAIFEAQRYHRSAYRALAQLQKTQRQLATWLPPLGAVEFFALGTFVIVLRRYQTQSEEIRSLQLSELEVAARKDALTGLGNSRAFGEMLDGIRSIAPGTDDELHLALIDVDNFKRVNDRHGHLHGDTILRTLGDLLEDMRGNAAAYRVGGDEFALAFRRCALGDVMSALGALHDAAHASLKGNTLSIGVASLGRSERNVNDLHERADVALYEAKHRGRNTTVAFDPALLLTSESIAARRAAFERMLSDPALLDVVFQPMWAASDGELTGYEAFIRFPGDFATPQDAFAVAERLDQVPALDARCLASIAQHLPSGLGGCIHVNLSAASLADGRRIASALAEFCERTALEASQITIEIGDHTVSAAALETATALRSRGYRIALDDVGRASAGLSTRTSMPFDLVKVDATMIAAVETDPAASAVMAGIFLIVGRMGRSLVVEGVETEGQIRYSRELAREFGLEGRTALQGYALGVPMPAESVDRRSVHPALAPHAPCVDADCGAVV